MREMPLRGWTTKLTALVWLTAPQVHAACNPNDNIDLRAVYPSVFDSLRVPDQGRIGLCYAYAASTLIDFYRIKMKSDRYDIFNTDPIDAAQAGTLESQDGDIEGGHVCDVVNGMVKRGVGYVSSQYNPAQMLDLGSKTQLQAVRNIFAEYLNEPKKFKVVDPKFFPPAKRASLPASQKTYLKKFDALLVWLKGELLARKMDLKKIPSDDEIFAFIQDNHVRNDYANFPIKFEMFIANDSTNRLSFKMPNLRCTAEKGLYDGYSYMNQLDITLTYQKLPIGIEMCAKALTQKGYKGYAEPMKAKSDCGLHALVVIGRRFGSRGCEYLIRNSWGNDYNGYAYPKDDGDVWIPEDALSGNLFGTAYIR
ncbi:MAG: hypothetical protein JST80_00800 [Bdellovibrionales bacterium]|nr:hypothetical protein [Bdellovibrionales bacterium]